MSRIRADKVINRAATGAPELTYGASIPVGYAITGAGGVNVTGVITATSFTGNLTGTASNVTTNANLTGHVTSVGNAAVLGSFTSAQLATALTDETGTGANVFATSPTLVTPALGTPSSGTLTNCTFPTLNQNTSGNAAGLSGTPNLNVGITTVTQLGINTTTIPTKLYVQGNAASNIVTLTDGATITPDFTLGNNFQVTIAASRTIANPTGVTTGQSGVIFIQENGTGGYTVGWGTSWDFASSTAPTLITTASALNALPYFARSTTSIVVGSVISGIGTL